MVETGCFTKESFKQRLKTGLVMIAAKAFTASVGDAGVDVFPQARQKMAKACGGCCLYQAVDARHLAFGDFGHVLAHCSQ